jgi:predicted Zn-dependent peptidase
MPVSELLDEGRYGEVRRTALSNGLRVITERMPGVRSVSVGFYIDIGSRDENEPLAGASHFLEHLLFKGTKRRSAWQISAEIEAVGGDSNAYTSKEHTCFHTQVLDRDLPLAIDVLCDMMTSSALDEREFDVERGVIVEEIAMREDEPADLCGELFELAALGDHPLARPILGTNASIEAMTRDRVNEFYRTHYVPPRMVVAAAGNLEHNQVVELVARGFAAADPSPERDTAAGLATPSRPGRHIGGTVPVIAGGVQRREKDIEQANLTIGVRSLSRYDSRRPTLAVLANVLGGGMSSRLFQEVRERRGLAYAVNTFTDYYYDVGFFGAYAGCSPGKLEQLRDVTLAELATVAKRGLSPDEVARGKGMITGSMVLDTEDTASRMGRIGQRELFYPDYLSIDEQLARVEAVGVDDVNQLASELLVEPYIVGLVGPPETAA